MKKLIVMILALCLALSFSLAVAETKISVSGSGETRISADTAVISLGVNARDKNVLKAQQKVNEAIAAIRKALIEQGVPEENITTDYININPIYDYSFDLARLTAYSANTILAIKVTDMDKVGALIDAAFEAGANDLNGITFSASDTREAKAEALKLAVEDAKQKVSDATPARSAAQRCFISPTTAPSPAASSAASASSTARSPISYST